MLRVPGVHAVDDQPGPASLSASATVPGVRLTRLMYEAISNGVRLRNGTSTIAGASPSPGVTISRATW